MRKITFCFLFLYLSCHKQVHKINSQFKEIYIGDKKVLVEIADTELERALGLMYRDSLPENTGMLFIFPTPGYYSFWMKNTKIPLSIAFCDTNAIIFQIEDMVPFDETNLKVPKKPIKYAIEMNKGWFQQNNIKLGTKIRFVE